METEVGIETQAGLLAISYSQTKSIIEDSKLRNSSVHQLSEAIKTWKQAETCNPCMWILDNSGSVYVCIVWSGVSSKVLAPDAHLACLELGCAWAEHGWTMHQWKQMCWMVPVMCFQNAWFTPYTHRDAGITAHISRNIRKQMLEQERWERTDVPYIERRKYLKIGSSWKQFNSKGSVVFSILTFLLDICRGTCAIQDHLGQLAGSWCRVNHAGLLQVNSWLNHFLSH